MNEPQRILITGTSSGFGRATALRLLERGHTVIATMRATGGRNAENVTVLKQLAAPLPGKLSVFELDVTDDTSVSDAVHRVEQRHGGIDVAINNAGIGPLGLTEAFTPDQLSRAFDTNVVGVQRVNRAVLPGMRARRKGLLVHLGSTMGRIVWPFAGPYTATKFALEGLIESLHYELADTGVEVSILQPGAFPTEMLKKVEGPGDPGRVESYGVLAKRPDNFWGPFMQALSNKNPDPGLVAEALLELVELPPGQRPLRRVVDVMGIADAVEGLNRAAQQVQKTLLTEANAEAFLRGA